MTAPLFRCTADEPPKRKDGMFGPEHALDSETGLVLDEFVFEAVVHMERMTDGYYHLRVGDDTYGISCTRGKWAARRSE